MNAPLLEAVDRALEGDWYRRCGRRLHEHVSTSAERQEIRAVLLG